MSPRIILITGIMAAGKSTVAQALAERLPKSVHLRGDLFRRMIVNGQAAMSMPLSLPAAEQLQLRYDLAIAAAVRYFDAGFNVVYQDIILGRALEDVGSRFAGRPLDVIVLAPDTGTIAQREQGRNKSGYRGAAEVGGLDRVLREETPHIGTWIDSSNLSVEQTVEAILQSLNLE